MQIKRTLRRCLRNKWSRIQPHTGLRGLDKKLLQYCDFENGFFVEAGANDGINQSNTYFLEKRRGWIGILIEPIPSLAAQCRVNRKAIIEEFALVAPSDVGAIQMLDLDLMSIVRSTHTSQTDFLQHIKDAEIVQDVKSSLVNVAGTTLTKILEKNNYPQIDLLSLDVEGYEIEVLKGLDLDKTTPNLILIETRKIKVVKELLGNKYRLIEQLSHHDYLFGITSA